MAIASANQSFAQPKVVLSRSYFNKSYSATILLFRLPMECLSKFCSNVIEYETPKVVTVHNPTIGLLRRSLQVGVVLYVGLYQLYYAKIGRVAGVVLYVGLYQLYYAKVGGGGILCRAIPTLLC